MTQALIQECLLEGDCVLGPAANVRANATPLRSGQGTGQNQMELVDLELRAQPNGAGRSRNFRLIAQGTNGISAVTWLIYKASMRFSIW